MFYFTIVLNVPQVYLVFILQQVKNPYDCYYYKRIIWGELYSLSPSKCLSHNKHLLWPATYMDTNNYLFTLKVHPPDHMPLQSISSKQRLLAIDSFGVKIKWLSLFLNKPSLLSKLSRMWIHCLDLLEGAAGWQMHTRHD
jgi:hypothetical protein